MWAQGRAKRREQQRLHVGLHLQTPAEISESVLIHLQHCSAHQVVGSCIARCRRKPSMPTARQPLQKRKEKTAARIKIRRDHLHVRVQVGDPALCNLPLVAHEDFSCTETHITIRKVQETQSQWGQMYSVIKASVIPPTHTHTHCKVVFIEAQCVECAPLTHTHTHTLSLRPGEQMFQSTKSEM